MAGDVDADQRLARRLAESRTWELVESGRLISKGDIQAESQSVKTSAQNGRTLGNPDLLARVWLWPSLKEELRRHVAKEIGALARPEEIRFTGALPAAPW